MITHIKGIYAIQMDQKCERLYSSAPVEKNIDLEQRLEKKLSDVNIFSNHINNIEGIITYFRDKDNESKKKSKKYQLITTILKLFDTFVIITTTSNSITLSLTGIDLIAIPKSTATACGISFGNKKK